MSAPEQLHPAAVHDAIGIASRSDADWRTSLASALALDAWIRGGRHRLAPAGPAGLLLQDMVAAHGDDGPAGPPGQPRPGAPTSPGGDPDDDAAVDRDARRHPQGVAHAAPGRRLRAASSGQDDATGSTGQPLAAQARSYRYDEWDGQARRFLRDWCRVIESRLPAGDTALLNEAAVRHAGLRRRLLADLRRVQPPSHRLDAFGVDGDELAMDRVVEELIDRRCGHGGRQDLYRVRSRQKRDMAVALLVDVSASTDFPLPRAAGEPPDPATDDPADDDNLLYGSVFRAVPTAANRPPRRRIIDVARESAALLADVLDPLGDAFAIYAFSGQGREQVDFLVAKAFDDAHGASTRARLAAMQPRGSTRTGAALRHAAHKLALHPAQRRMLILLTDGYPQDTGYGPDPADPRHGVLDTAHALDEAAAAGLLAFTVSIDPAGNDYLQAMCPPAQYLVLKDIDTLPAELGKVYRALRQG